MADKLIPLKLPPGLFMNGTRYQAKGRWYDAHLVRFASGTIQPVGGWRRAQDDTGGELSSLQGVPRGALVWRLDTGELVFAFGTTKKLYVLTGGTLHDVTPVGFTEGAADAAFATASGAYGDGVYGSGAYGVGSLAAQLVDADTWQLDTFGDFLVAVCTSDEKLYVWQADPAVVAAVATGSPTASAVVATPERFLFALGAAGNGRLVRWPSQEGFTDWTPSGINSAGDFELATNGRIMAGRRTRGQTLIFTDSDLHVAQYIGAPFYYRFDQAGDNCGLLARNAVAIVDTQAYWMGRDNFFRFDGFVKPLDSEVRDYVFSDFNYAQAAKVCAVSIGQYGEVWWFYPSANATEIDRYVTYNYRENHWVVGRLARTAGIDAGPTAHPVMLSSGGLIFEHEVLDDKIGTDTTIIVANGSENANGEYAAGNNFLGSETPWLESGPLELGDGDKVLHISRIVPDERTIGDTEATIFGSFDPTSAETAHGPYSIAQPTDVRITARQIRLRLDQIREVSWRIGDIRLGVKEGGRR